MKCSKVELSTVANVVSGCGFPRKYQGVTDREIPFFKVSDMNVFGNEYCMRITNNTISMEILKKLRAKLFPEGTIIFPKIGAAIATNKKRMLIKPAVVDNNIMGLIPKPKINHWFLYYWLLQLNLQDVSNIGPVPSIRKSVMEQLLIPLPSLSQQQHIVEILDQAKVLQQKSIEANSIAKKILASVFYEMFGDPNTNTKGWNQLSFKDLFEDHTAHSPKLLKQNVKPSGKYPVIDQGQNFIAGYYDDRSLVTNLTEPCIVFGDHTRRVKFVDFPFIAGADGSKILKVKKESSPAFLATQLKLLAIPNLGYSRHMRVVRQLKFIVPPHKLQLAFSRRFLEWQAIFPLIEKRTIRTQTLFNILLYHAFSGNLTTSWHTNTATIFDEK